MQQIDHVLPWSACGTRRTLSVLRFGSGPRKAYIQASLHADELPGMRVAVELKARLRELEAQGRLTGVIELVPLANPIGIGQMFQATHQVDHAAQPSLAFQFGQAAAQFNRYAHARQFGGVQ